MYTMRTDSKMTKAVVTVLLMLGLTLHPAPSAASEVTCAAYSPQCGFPDAPQGVVISEPTPVPQKCAKKKYRKAHKQKCRAWSAR